MKYEVSKIYKKIVEETDKLADEYIPNQVDDPQRPDFGGYFSPQSGCCDACHVGTGMVAHIFGCCYFSEGSKYYNDGEMKERLINSLKFIKSQVRKSGFIDLLNNNYDSPPDTAFMINGLAQVAYMAKKSEIDSDGKIYNAVIDIILPCAGSVAAGGFHTPNHRWVVCSALAQVMELEPEKCDFREIMERYFAETVDMNADGFYFEKSLGVYDKVLDTRFIILGETYNGEKYKKEDYISFSEKNLDLRLDLMNNDRTMDTSVSSRQDHGKKYYLDCCNAFLYMAIERNNPEFAKAALAALENPISEANADLGAALYYFSRHPEWKEKSIEVGELRTDCDRLMSESGIYRVKKGKLSATAKLEASDFFNVKYGNVTLAEVRVLLAYFGGAKYKANKITKTETGVKLSFYSEHNVAQHPAYWMPLGRKVERAELPFNNVGIRELNKRPEFDLSVEIIKTENGFDLHTKSDKGMNGVKFSMEFLFLPVGKVETENVSFNLREDETMFLKEGSARIVNNGDFIKIDGGCCGHRLLAMNEGTNGLFRIALTDFSPIDRVVHIEYGEWSGKDEKCSAEKLYIK